MSTKGISANRLELLQIADAVAREKSIDKSIVISAMEEAIQKAAASRYGIENNIKAEIDSETGSIELKRLLDIVEKVEDFSTQITLEEAKLKNPNAEIGEILWKKNYPQLILEELLHKVQSKLFFKKLERLREKDILKNSKIELVKLSTA